MYVVIAAIGGWLGWRVVRAILAEPEYGTVGYDHERNESIDRRKGTRDVSGDVGGW
jgi:hypothetical protein